MRPTKKQMTKDIFFLATKGQRTPDNYVAGMGIIDAIANHNYRFVIQEAWDRVNEAGDQPTAREEIRRLATYTFYNLPFSTRHYFYADRRKFDF